VIGGTPQGFVLFKDLETTTEDPSCYITNLQYNAGNTQITSYNHCVNVGDYLYITNCLGYIFANNKVGQVLSIIDANNFVIDIAWNSFSGIYQGLGLITKLVVPLLQSKQFPSFFEIGRQTRLGAQQYMLDATTQGQITLEIYLSMDAINVRNAGPIVPTPGSLNNTLIYSQLVYTCPDFVTVSSNQLPLGIIGNGVLTSFTFNYFTLFNFSSSIIAGSVFINVGNVATFLDNGLGGFVVTGTGTMAGSSINYITGVIVINFTTAPLNQISITNFQYRSTNIQSPTAATQQQIWHRMNTSLIGDTVQIGITLSDEQMRNYTIATSEITLHAAVINTTPGPLLS